MPSKGGLAPVPVSQKEAEDFFKSCDANKDGTVTIGELQRRLCRSGIPSQNVAHMFADIDKNADGAISRKEFVEDVCAKARSESIKEVFESMDRDRSGAVDMKELVDNLLKSGFKDVDALKEVFEKADTDRNGKINLQEFEYSMKRQY